MKLPIPKIDTDQSVQVRDVIHMQTVEDYADHITAGGPPLPPIVVYGPDSRGMYFLSEGWHRLAAHKKAGRTTIAATVREGGWKDALQAALGSNAAHGLPRTNKDKRRVVELALKHWPGWSDTLIAERCAVSDRFVRDVRSELQPRNGSTPDVPQKRLGKDGKTYTVPPPPPSQPPATPAPSAKKPEPPPLPVDPAGRTILPHLLGIWAGRERLTGMAKQIGEVRRAVEQAFDDRDPLFAGSGQGVSPVDRQGLIAALSRAEKEIKAAVPWGLCGMCNGTGCRACSGNGLVTKVQHDRLAPEFR
jgi:uncharacterized ParB-like nuclease family protein